MRSTIAFAIAAIVLAALGSAFLGVARLEGHMADAGQRLSTLEYSAAQESLTEADQYASHARFVPWLGSDARQEIRARQAAVQYWQRQYDVVLPAGAEPVAAVDEENVELQLVVANSAYRVHQTEFKDKQSTIKALEENMILDPGFRETRPKLYSLLIARADRLVAGGDREGAFPALMRALEVLPDAGEAQKRLASYTPTPRPECRSFD